MSSLWQKLRNPSGGLLTRSFVTNIFNRSNYRDLDSDNVEESESAKQIEDGANSDGFDEVDAGLVGRRKYIDLLSETGEDPSVVELQWTKGDDMWGENNRNELTETIAKGDQYTGSNPDEQETLNERENPPEHDDDNNVHNEPGKIGQEHSNDTSDKYTQKQTGDLTDEVSSRVKGASVQSSSDSGEQSKHYRRPRRDSYDKALAEMRNSYDRLFGDISDEPPVIATSHDVWIKRNTSFGNGFDSHSHDAKSSVSRKPFRRQISSTIQQEIPSAINVIRQRSYSKLGEDLDEIVDITDTAQSKSSEWHTSFPVQEKKKRQKRSKKVWKKTKKAARISWKWLKRSFIAYSSSYHHGIPMTVAMYGGSKHQGRPKFYDYR